MKSPSEAQLKQQAIEAVVRCLAEVPFCRVESARVEKNGVNGIITVRIPDEPQTILIEAKRNGEPRLVRDAVNGLLRYRAAVPGAYAVFVAPYISPAAAEIATQDGVGYVDLAGNCLLSFNRIYIRRDGRPNPYAQRRVLRSLYSPKAERVLRTLLNAPRRGWKVADLAQSAGVSLGQAANVKKLLEDREWIARGEGGLRLIRPAELLEEWGRQYRPQRNAVYDYYSLEPPAAIETALALACEQLGQTYALTGFSAAARMAPMVRYQRAAAYVVGGTAALVDRLKLKPVASGANVSLIAPYDDGVLAGASRMDGIHLVSPVQAYLDLLGNKARGEEAAQAVLEQVIKPTW